MTVISMAALGVGTDMRAVAKAGGRVVAAVVLSRARLALHVRERCAEAAAAFATGPGRAASLSPR